MNGIDFDEIRRREGGKPNFLGVELVAASRTAIDRRRFNLRGARLTRRDLRGANLARADRLAA